LNTGRFQYYRNRFKHSGFSAPGSFFHPQGTPSFFPTGPGKTKKRLGKNKTVSFAEQGDANMPVMACQGTNHPQMPFS